VRPTDAAACARIFDRAWHAGHPYAPREIDRAAFEAETRGDLTELDRLLEEKAKLRQKSAEI